jgi:hypothetical protein
MICPGLEADDLSGLWKDSKPGSGAASASGPGRACRLAALDALLGLYGEALP